MRRAERTLHTWQSTLLDEEVRPATPATESRQSADPETPLELFAARVGRIVTRARAVAPSAAVTLAPTPDQVDATVGVLDTWAGQDQFFTGLAQGRPLDASLVAAGRAVARKGSLDGVRSWANALRETAGLQTAGEVVTALVALEDASPALAWELLSTIPRDEALRLAPAELFRAGFRVDPGAATQALREALQEDLADVTPTEWLDIAGTSFGSGAEVESRQALARARVGAEAAGRKRLLDRIAWLEDWYGTAEAARGPAAAETGAVPFAVLDYKQPDEAFASKNLGDHVQTIASLGHLVRRSGFRFTGDPDLVDLATSLQQRVKPERVVDGDDAVLDLRLVQRDASHHDLIPDGTWALAFGWYMHPQFGVHFDMPFNPRIRPIFVSFHVNAPAFLDDEVIAYLRRHAPVGCRDWNTVHLLLAAGVPAFFSGCITTTVDTVFPPSTSASPKGTLYVDTPETGPGTSWRQTAPEIRRRTFARNVRDALKVLAGYQDRYAHVVTSRLHCYLPARSVGADVEFRPKNPADVRFDGLAGIDDAAYEDIRQGMLARLEPVLGAIGAGRPEDEVYALWREVNAADVAKAEQRHRDLPDLGQPSFDVGSAVEAIRAGAVSAPRSQPANPASDATSSTEPVVVAVSVDGDDVDTLSVLLDSLETHSSRPLDVHVVGRGLTRASWDELVRAFPSVGHHWWPTDDVPLGTGDRRDVQRLLLPELLDDVRRVVHLDPSVLVLGDVAELADLPLDGHPLAARTATHHGDASGFGRAIDASKQMPTDPLARQLVRHTHARHAFDYPAFDAAVMVLDLDRLRQDDLTRSFVPWLEHFGLTADDVLVFYAGPACTPLDPRWNQLARHDVLDEPKAISWGGERPAGPTSIQGQGLWRAAAARAGARLAETRAPQR